MPFIMSVYSAVLLEPRDKSHNLWASRVEKVRVRASRREKVAYYCSSEMNEKSVGFESFTEKLHQAEDKLSYLCSACE